MRLIFKYKNVSLDSRSHQVLKYYNDNNVYFFDKSNIYYRHSSVNENWVDSKNWCFFF